MAQRPFRCTVHGPVVTLIFGSATAQHAALSRLECFYESEKFANTYLTLEEAARERICKGYEAFNLPTATVPRWLEAMHESEKPEPSEELPWWHKFCTVEERAVLEALEELDTQPSYVVSALAQHADVALAHERLHALYHLSEPYRTLLTSLWNDMPRSVQSAVQYDLKMRGYREAVWEDELGAYLGVRIKPNTRRADPSLEFGNKCADVCREIRRVLLQQIPTFWRADAGVDEAAMELDPSFLEEARAALAPPKRPTQAPGLPKKPVKGAPKKSRR